MQYSRRVRLRQSVGDLDGIPDGISGSQARGRDQLPETVSFDVFHRDEINVAIRADLINRDDVRVV